MSYIIKLPDPTSIEVVNFHNICCILISCVVVDGSIVYNSAEINFTHVTSLRDFDYPRYQYEESTLRIRATVIARSSAHAGMVDGQIYWIETTATIADDYVYAGRYGIKYGSTVLNFYQTVSKERKQ